MPVRWETPEVLSYSEEALIAEVAAAATVTPIFCDLPFMDYPDSDDDGDDD